MFVIAIPTNGKYVESYFYRMKNGKPQVFTFKDQNSAVRCIEMFQQYAGNMLMQTGDLMGIPGVMSFCSQLKLIEVPNGFTCELIDFDDILREKGI